MTEEQKRDMKIDNGITIKQWIDYNINKYGAQNFFDCINNGWDDEVSESIKQSILMEIKKQIKPTKIETIEDLALLLNGNQYGDELINDHNIDVYTLCEEKKWIVVFGYSDDCVELRGCIDDELGGWDGTLLKLVKPGDFYHVDDDEDDVYHKASETKFVNIELNEFEEIKDNNYKDNCIIEALWCPNDSEASWQFNCGGAPSARFNIMEDEELYAECLVIDLNKLLN